MIRIPKTVVSFGALALAAGALTLAVPRAAHALAAALVQVINSTASPANTEDTSRQASQLVQLACAGNGTSACVSGEYYPLLAGVKGPAYTVPDTQSLVITSAELFPEGLSSILDSVVILTDNLALTAYHDWLVGGSNIFQYQYPSKIVLPPGTQPAIYSNVAVVVQINGYLTTN